MRIGVLFKCESGFSSKCGKGGGVSSSARGLPRFKGGSMLVRIVIMVNQKVLARGVMDKAKDLLRFPCIGGPIKGEKVI